MSSVLELVCLRSPSRGMITPRFRGELDTSTGLDA
jgi:hypothetical protein